MELNQYVQFLSLMLVPVFLVGLLYWLKSRNKNK